MAAVPERVYWLDVRSDRALLMHALCGDALAPPAGDFGGAFFDASGISRGERIVVLRFEHAGAAMCLCAVAPKTLTPDCIRRLRADLSPAGAERRWGPFVSQLGKYKPMAALATPSAWEEGDVMRQGRRWRTRRPRHPSVLVDRLSKRDRIEWEVRLAEAMGARNREIVFAAAATSNRDEGDGAPC